MLNCGRLWLLRRHRQCYGVNRAVENINDLRSVYSVVFGDRWSKLSAKPLFIGSIPIAASKKLNSLPPD